MVPVGHVRMGSTGVRAPVWTASGMGHWKRLIKIPGGTDCYYCIDIMTYLIHVYSCLVVLVTVPDHLAAIILHVFTWYRLHFLWWHTTHVYVYSLLHIFCFLYTLKTALLSIHNTYYGYIAYAHLHVHFYHVTTSMFISITSPLDHIIYDIIDMTRWNRLGSDGIKRRHVYIFLLLINNKLLMYCDWP